MHTQKQDQTASTSLLRKPLLMIAVVAAALAFSKTAHAQAPATADNGVRCVGRHPNGDLEFFLPGEKAYDANGNRMVCGPDGKWFLDMSLTAGTPPVRNMAAVAALAPAVATAVLR